MNLRDLPDLELAVLVGLFHEMTLAAAVTEACPEFFADATRLAIGAAIARKTNSTGAERLFPERAIPIEKAALVVALLGHGRAQLEKLGCGAAAAYVQTKLQTEMNVDTSHIPPARAGIEFRSLH